MYNNFSSKKTKKVISALLASALVVTSAPISADAAIVKPLGVGKSFTVSGKKVTKLDSKEKKVVSVSIKNGKVTVKGKKAGKVSFKIGNKTYNVNVGATKVTATAAATTLKVNDKTTVAIKATNGAKDKLTIKTSKSSVVKIGKSSVTADKNGKASVTLRGLAAGTSTITVKSANTGMYAKVKITVKADETATAAPSSDAPATLAPATDAPVGPTVVPTSGGAVTTAPTSGGAVTAAPTATPATGSAIATASAVTASAVNAKTIAIQFNRALTDAEQKEVTTTVMNGNVEVIVTTKFADAKTLYITKADDSVYTAATYTITVSGKTVASVSNVAVQARKLASIEITNDQLISSAVNSGYFYYKIKDQYGVDYTADIPNASLKTIGSDSSTVELNPTTGKGTVTKENLFASNSIIKTVVVSIVDPATGTTVSKSLVCSPAAKLANFKLGTISYPANATRYYTGSSEAAKIAVDAVDTYGNKITDATTLNNDVQLVSSDADVVATFTADENNVAYISVDTTALLTAKQVTITAVVKETGAISNFTLDIVKQAEPTKIEFGSLNKNVLALGDTAYMDITVYNQFGDVMAAKDYVNTLQVSGTAGLSSNVSVVTSGTNAGKLELAPTDTIGIATIAVTLGGKNYTTTVDVKAARVLTSVVAPKSVSLLQGVSGYVLGFTFKDQYGDTIVPTTTIDDMSYDVTVTKLSGDTDGLTCNRGTGNDERELTDINVTAASNKTGVYNVKVALLNNGGAETSNASVKVTVLSDVANGLTYAVKDITLVPSAANNETSPYAKQVVVEGTDAAGNKVILPSDMIKGYSIANNVGDYFGVDATEGVVYVATPGTDIPTNAKVAVTLNVSTGTQTIYSNVLTSSKDSAKVSSIEIYKLRNNNAANATELGTNITTGVTSLPIEATPVSTITYTGVEKYCLVTKDQYGVYKAYTDNTADLPIDINTKAVTAGGTAKVDKTTGLLDFSGITDAVYNKPITMSATINGVTSTFTTTFIGAIATLPAIAESGAIVKTGYAAGNTITLKFSEAVKVSNVTLLNLTISGGHTFGTDATIVATEPTNGCATQFVITLGEGANVAADDTITISAANVEDVVGNVASANVVFTCPE